MNKKIYFGLFLPLLLFVSCNSEDAPDLLKTRGSYVERTQSTGYLWGIDAGKGIDVILQQGDEPQLLIKGWKNLLPNVSIHFDTVKSILHIEDKNKYDFVRSYDNRTTIHVTYVTQPGYFRVEADANMQTLDTLRNEFLFLGEYGGGNASFLVNNSSIVIGVNMVVDVHISGKTNFLDITNWGKAPLRFEDLACNEAKVTHHGPSNVFVNVRDILTAELFSTGNIYYSGNPTIKEVRHAKGKLYQNKN